MKGKGCAENWYDVDESYEEWECVLGYSGRSVRNEFRIGFRGDVLGGVGMFHLGVDIDPTLLLE